MPVIYLLTNTVNGKPYVGQTIQEERDRWNSHCSAARIGGRLKIDRAIRKYGPEAFRREILEELPKEDLDDAEKFWIALYESIEFGYNTSEGGKGCRGFKMPRDAVERTRAALTGRKASPEAIEKMKKAQQRLRLDPEHRKKLSESHIGRGWSDKRRAAQAKIVVNRRKKQRARLAAIVAEIRRKKRSDRDLEITHKLASEQTTSTDCTQKDC